jgi:predicted neuraminidase
MTSACASAVSNLAAAVGGLSAAQPALLRHEFVFETASFPSCHASTLVETVEGTLVVAWFGGKHEKAADVGIWVSRREGGAPWTAPVEVATGVQADGSRQPCWNPVLFQPQGGPLLLFYKVGPNPRTWWGLLRTSADDGRTWSEARRLPDGILGPIKNKPVQLPNGDILCPSSSEHAGWRVHFERSSDGGQTWTASAPLNDGKAIGAIQPSILFAGRERLLAIGRTQQGKVFRTQSADLGHTWGPLTLTELPNPDSGTDAVTLRDGRHVLVYNHTPKGRSPLNIAVSVDVRTWQAALVLEDEPGEYSYPAVIQTRDGLVHSTYTWKRQRIRYAVVDPAKLAPKSLVGGRWPPEVYAGSRSPMTNGAEWQDDKPVALPGALRPNVESVFLYRPESEWTYSHHASITVFKDHFYAIWSNSRTDEDAPGQRVLLSTAADFAHWSQPRALVDSVTDENGSERVLTAAGFHQHGATLVAYFGNYGPHKETTRLQAVVTTDGRTWSTVREVGIPVNPNHPPQRTASGRLILCGNISFAYTDSPGGLEGWQMSGMYPPDMAATIKDDPASFWEVAKRQGWPTALCEGSFFQTDDGTLHMLLRGTGEQHRFRLWLVESRDDGATWSAPVETGFSNTDAKFHCGRLPDGRFYYVGNPIGAGRTPLILSLSADGTTFNQHYILGETPYAQQRPGRWKGGEYGYPHSLVHEGFVYVIVSRQKEAVEVLRVALSELR